MKALRFASVLRWIDSQSGADRTSDDPGRIDLVRLAPFAALHVACVAVWWVGWSPVAVAVAVAAYAVRMFAITGFYHRYFSHRAFRTSRAAQLVFAVLGATAVQRGPLWWAGHHRHHHAHADGADDIHSPRQRGFCWSHVGWILAGANFRTRTERVADLARYPELRFLDRFDSLVPAAYAASTWALGAAAAAVVPGLGTSGPQMFVWAFVVSTVVLYHMTFAINSLAHQFGSRPFETRDDSRNNPLLALVTFGEGWHNNHHHAPSAARQGFNWWEVDLTFYALWLLARLGVIWDLNPAPAPEARSAAAARGR